VPFHEGLVPPVLASLPKVTSAVPFECAAMVGTTWHSAHSMAGRSGPSWRWRRWAPTALVLGLVSPLVPLGGAAGSPGFVDVARRVPSPWQSVQALLPPVAPPPAADKATGRGSEQAASHTMKDARTMEKNALRVPCDPCPDINPSQSTNSHIAKNALTCARMDVLTARDRPACAPVGWDDHLHECSFRRPGVRGGKGCCPVFRKRSLEVKCGDSRPGAGKEPNRMRTLPPGSATRL